MAAPLIPLMIALGAGMMKNANAGKETDFEKYLKNRQIGIDQENLPVLDAFQFTPEETQYTTISEDPTYRSRQMALLDKLSALGDTGLSDADKASYAQGIAQANQAARQRNSALMNEMRSRGQGGSGLEYALREQAGQEALNRQAQQGLAQAGDSARQRALYQQAYGNALAGQREQDYKGKAANADIVNKFNMLNTQNRNEAALANMERKNAIAQQEFQNRMARSGAANQITNQVANAMAAREKRKQGAEDNLINTGASGLMGMFG